MVQTPVQQRSDNPSLESIKPVITDQWVNETWERFIEITSLPEFEKAKAYYFNGQMRIEAMGVGANHGLDNTILILIVNLFGMVSGVALDGLTNASYRRPHVKEVQPDVSYYIGDRADLSPKITGIIDLNEVPVPDLAIEIAVSSLSEDLGKKRLMYEAIGIPEYWVIDVERAEIIAFAIHDRGSTQISESRVLPGLSFDILTEALRLSRTQNQSQVGQWLMQQFQSQSSM